jgi:hypothetical protein
MRLIDRFPTVLSAVAVSLALGLGGCASKQKKKAAPPPPVEEPAPAPAPDPVAATVTDAKLATAAGPMQPSVELTVTGPAGWECKVKEKVTGNDVHLSVMAVAPEGVTEKGADAAIPCKHAVGKLSAGKWKVHVWNGKVSIKTLTVEY